MGEEKERAEFVQGHGLRWWKQQPFGWLLRLSLSKQLFGGMGGRVWLMLGLEVDGGHQYGVSQGWWRRKAPAPRL